MLWTLQRYILREMGKTFILTAIGMIGVITLAGGVVNVISFEGVAAHQVLRLVALAIPLAAAVALPVATLFSATLTYGRMAADNEFVACRSGGINIHRLFFPAMLFAMFSAGCSFFFINFLIPGILMNLGEYMAANMPQLIRQQLSQPERLSLKDDSYRIYAQDSKLTEGEAGEAGQLQLLRAVFIAKDKDEWTQVGTAERAKIGFVLKDESFVVNGDMYNLSVCDLRRGQITRSAHLGIDPTPIPKRIPLRVRWLDLGGLIRYGSQPLLFPDIEKGVQRLRDRIATSLFLREAAEQFRHTDGVGSITLRGDGYDYTLEATSVRFDEQTHMPVFSGVVVVKERRADYTRVATAETAMIDVDDDGQGRPIFHLRAEGNVTIEDSREPGVELRRAAERFDPVPLPQRYRDEAAGIPVDEILSADEPMERYGEEIARQHGKLLTQTQTLKRDIIREIHSRSSFSLSILFLVLLGAALGIVFRGAHMLVAFGISFVPTLFVIVMIIMGKSLADKPGLVMVGVAVMWGGLAIVAIIDAYVMTRVLRR